MELSTVDHSHWEKGDESKENCSLCYFLSNIPDISSLLLQVRSKHSELSRNFACHLQGK